MKLTANTILNLMPESIPAEHDGALMEFARAIETTVRQQDAELVRELVEVLSINAEFMNNVQPYPGQEDLLSDALEMNSEVRARAQQWLEENKCP